MVEWNDGLSIGVKVLDDDHKNLLNIINRLFHATNENQNITVIEEIFEDLTKYALIHFKREEEFLKKCNYEDFNAHQNQHQSFTDKIPKLKEKLLSEHDSLNAHDINIYLTDWLINHIIAEDMPAITLFEECGITETKDGNLSPIEKIIKKTTDTFSFTKRILLSALVPLFGMLILGLIIIWNNYTVYTDMKRTSEVTHIISNVNELVHNLQIERGLSAGYLTSTDDKFKQNLINQNIIVDKTIKSFNKKSNEIDTTKLIIDTNIMKFKTDVNALNSIREKIYTKKLNLEETIDSYTKIIHNILDVTSKIAFVNQKGDVSSSISTLSSILHFKEILGLKRALGTIIIEKKSTNTQENRMLLILFGSQQTYFDKFTETATRNQKEIINNILNSDIAKEILQYEDKIIKNDFENLNSKAWFELTTKHIDKIKQFEDKLLNDVKEVINNYLDKAVEQLILWLIYITFIMLVTFIVIFIFEKSSKIQLYSFIDAMKHIANSGRSLRLKPSHLKDEISQVYSAYETTRQALLKGDIYSQLYLSQKEIELKKQKIQNDKLEELAYVDPLTGALNRRKFEELSSLELKRSIRYKNKLTFLILDIDYFKAVNDTYGHAVGDEVLKHFSFICLDLIRNIDVFSRIGGEEFVVMLPETDTEGAYIFAERFRKKINNSTILIDGHTITYTVSIGISTLDFENDKEVSTILQRADSALYEAKENGRNQSIAQ